MRKQVSLLRAAADGIIDSQQLGGYGILTFVVKDLSLTSAAFWMKRGSLSSHSVGTFEAASV